jgi:hypothetical protein
MPGKACIPRASGPIRIELMTISASLTPTLDPSLAPGGADTLAAIDALHRFAAGIDTRDRELFASALTDDAVLDLRPAATKAGFEFPLLEGKAVILDAVSTGLQACDTTHSVSNARVAINGDEARIDALVEAQHVSRNDDRRHYLMKNRYDAELVRAGDIWLIARATIDNVWRSGDPAVLSAA